MATLNRLRLGQVVYDVRRDSRNRSGVSIWPVRIVEVNEAEGWVLASYNGRSPRKYGRKEISKWRVDRPQPKRVTAKEQASGLDPETKMAFVRMDKAVEPLVMMEGRSCGWLSWLCARSRRMLWGRYGRW